MSLRAYTDHVDDYNRTHTIEIHKDGYSGSVDYLKNTGEGYASFDYEKIDPKNPTDNPIQKGALEFSLWLQSSDLIDDIKTADEQTFWAVHKVDGSQVWEGYIYNDLSTYEEGFEDHPFRITLMAKDFTDLGGKDYLVSGSLPDSRERVIATIAHLLDTVGFSMPIKTHTSWIEENLEGSGDYDYLDKIYHETKALREFGRTGDETDQPITVEDALNKLCVNHGLLLKQADGAYWIDQLTEYEDPLNVQEAEYDLTGAQSSLTTGNDLTVDANTSDLKVTIQQDNRDNSGLPGLKRAKNKFNHRTQVSNIQFPNTSIVLDSDNSTYSIEQFFLSDGSQKISINLRVNSEAATEDGMQWGWRIKADTEYWDNDANQWDENATGYNLLDLTSTGLTDAQGNFQYVGFLDKTTTEVPDTADGPLVVEFRRAANGGFQTTEVLVFEFSIINAIASENSTSINYQLTQADDFSVVSELEDTWYGDGPIGYSTAALRYSANDNDTTSDSWQRKGSTSYRNFHWNLLAEHLDVRRGWRRLLSATLKGLYYPWQILSYDSEYFYFLGGSWDLFTGNWEGELFSLDIETGADTFDDIPKFTDETGTGSTGGSSGGGGLDQSTADKRYFKQNSLFSEIATGDQNEAIGNLGIAATKDELNILDGATLSTAELNLLDGVTATTAELNQLDGNVFTSGITGTTADFSGALEADTLRTDTGKFLSPTSYAFRNAGDTGFRDVEMAGLTATTGSFSDDIGFNSSNYDGAIRHRVGTTDNVVFGFKNDTSSTFFAGFDVDNDVFGFVEGVTPIVDSGVRIFTNGNMFVDGGLFAKEFVVDQERTFFSFNLSPGGGKVSSVSGSTGSEVVVFEDTDGTAFTPVDEDDIIVIQERTGLNSGAIVKSIRRRVASLSGTDITLTDSGISWDSGTDDVGSIEVGDNAVVKGNTTKAVRDGYIEYIVQADMPYQSVWDGVDDVGGGFEALRVGGMDGFDGSITGEVGIAGATQSDGAVFWITEDEAKIGAFTFDDISLSNDDIYIGDQVQSASERMRLGMRETGGGDRYPYFRIEDDQGNPRIAIVSREEVDGFAGLLALDASQNTLAKIGTENRIAGSYFDSTDMFGFSGTPPADPYANKDQASVRVDFENGEIFYDGIYQVIYTASSVAEFGSGNEAGGIFDDSWDYTFSGGGSGDPRLVLETKYIKRFGINKAIMTGFFEVTNFSGNGNSATITLSIGGQTDSYTINSVTGDNFELEVDISSITSGSDIEARVEITGDPGGTSGTDAVSCSLREDIIILGVTDEV